MANRKKILIGLVVTIMLIIGLSIFFNKSSKTVLETYTLNYVAENLYPKYKELCYWTLGDEY